MSALLSFETRHQDKYINLSSLIPSNISGLCHKIKLFCLRLRGFATGPVKRLNSILALDDLSKTLLVFFYNFVNVVIFFNILPCVIT